MSDRNSALAGPAQVMRSEESLGAKNSSFSDFPVSPAAT
jgi:hypothetical protein